VRKVFGADIGNIFMLLNKQFIGLALIAFIIAAPLSWYVMKQWLESFEYGVSMSWYLFVISMLVGLFIAVITVSYHAIKACKINPADTLKYE
ncbi:MAG: FtsX-like permease family protein, partial [Fulvivirga sp.]|nr:FtsX-like permease family protein [Fulvivirga sp.]